MASLPLPLAMLAVLVGAGLGYMLVCFQEYRRRAGIPSLTQRIGRLVHRSVFRNLHRLKGSA